MSKSKVLKMIADWRFSSNKPVGTREWGDIDPSERDNNSWWLHKGRNHTSGIHSRKTYRRCLHHRDNRFQERNV